MTKKLWFPSILTAIAFSAHAESLVIGGVKFSSERVEVAAGEKTPVFSDLNQDGHQDLVLTEDSKDRIVVFLGDGEGRLKKAGYFTAGRNPTSVAAVDINADSKIDLVVANHETNYLTLLVGDGHGGFAQAANSPLTINVDPHPHVVMSPDIDGDGHVDLVVDHRAGHGLLIVKGLGKGLFDTPGALIGMDGDPYLGMAIEDINRDGHLDLVTPNQGEVGIALNTGSEETTFNLVDPVAVASPFAVALADLDADGVLDLIAASDSSATNVEIFKGNGGGQFASLGSPLRAAGGAKNIATGDINGDSVDDALITSWSSGALAVLGGLAPFETVHMPLEGTENPWGLAISDINEDGIDDFVICEGVRPIARLYLSESNE